MRKPIVYALAAAALSMGAFALGRSHAMPNPADRVFEMRTYYAAPGKLDALQARFRDHTVGLFKKHGMTSIGYWTPRDDENGKGTKLVYILAYPDKAAAEKAWAAFRADPEWIAAKEASEKDGKLVEKVESVFLDPTDYSAIR
ncbi:MAG: NIPSNAP family protein [Isosphaeraceae bacterium]